MPVVIHVFDSVTSIDDVPNHAGYEYLEQELVSEGLVTVAISTNFANVFDSALDTRAETVLAVLDKLRVLNGDSTSIYFKRLDLDKKIGLFGHSRGGDAIVRVVKLNAQRTSGKFGIVTACSLAPSDFTGTVPGGTRMTLEANDLAFYFVMCPTNDGDVSGKGGAAAGTGTGFRHYARARCPKALVQVTRCCHNRFNSVWGDPAQKFGGDESTLSLLEKLFLRSMADHQSLVNEYVGGLFMWQLKGGPSPLALFNGGQANSLGAQVALQWSFGSTVKVVDDFENATKSNIGGARTPGVGGVTDLTTVTVAANTIEVGAAGTTSILTHVTHASRVLHADVTGALASTIAMTLDIPAAQRDWSSFQSLIVDLTASYDITTSTNLNNSPRPKVSITLVDTTPLYHEVKDGHSPPTFVNVVLFRFETMSLPLASFAGGGGVDLKKLKSLVVEVDPMAKTHVMLDSIKLVKP